MPYLEGAREPEPNCFLCAAAADPAGDRKALVLLRRERSFVIFNRYPYSNGHMMVAPNGHLPSLREIPDEAMLELMRLTRDCQAILTEAMRPDGFNIGINLGRAAGAGVPGHLHVHIVPRWNGDTNFMGTVGETRVIPEALEATFEKLRAAAGRLGIAGVTAP
jgi:ATP adenylyltransferase